MHDPDRDASVDRLLRRAFRSDYPPGSTTECLDVEALAAWAGGGLPATARAAAEAHTAGCARCQALLAAMVRTEAVPGLTSGPARARAGIPGILRWLVPVTAAAAAAVLWVAVRPDVSTRTPVETAATLEHQVSPPSAAPPMEPGVAGRTAAPAVDESLRREPMRGPEQRQKPDAGESASQALRKAAPPAADAGQAPLRDVQVAAESQIPPVPPLPAATPAAPELTPARASSPPVPAPRAEALRFGGRSVRLEDRSAAVMPIPSADPASRWRIVNGLVVQHSADAGANWETRPIGSVAVLTAGVSPSATVCWIVGRAGTVLLTTDGTVWQSVTFPENVDLMAVTATDARAAIVTTVDKRTFETIDGGVTWARKD